MLRNTSKVHDCKDTGHGIHPAGDAGEHVSLVREILLCGYCNAAGGERDGEYETDPSTNIIAGNTRLQFVFSISERTVSPLSLRTS